VGRGIGFGGFDGLTRCNRWVAGPRARYFEDTPPLAKGGRGDLPISWTPSSPTRPRSSACAWPAASGMRRCLRGSGCWGSMRGCCPQAQGSRGKVQVKGEGWWFSAGCGYSWMTNDSFPISINRCASNASVIFVRLARIRFSSAVLLMFPVDTRSSLGGRPVRRND